MIPDVIVQSSHLALRRQNITFLHHRGHTGLVQHGHKGFSYPQVDQGVIGVEIRIDPERLGSGLGSPLFGGRVGMQRVLYFVAKLCQHAVGNVPGTLGDEIDPHTLGTDQLHHLLNFGQQGFGGAVKQQMRLVKEKHHLGGIQISGLRQDLKQF